MSQKWQERLIAFGLCMVLIILLIPLIMIARYNFMSMDDYTYGNIVHGNISEGQTFWNILQVQAKNAYECWSTWQGQYFANWLIMVFLALGGGEHYYLVVMITLIPLLLAEFFLGYVVLGKGFKASFSQVCIAVIPMAIYHISFPPSTAEAFYWLCGAVTYTTAYAISLFALGLLVNLLYVKQNSRMQNMVSVMILLLLSVCLGGSNFVTGLFMLLVCFLFAVYGIFVKHKHALIYVINLLVYVACFLLTALSPGASNRRADTADMQVPALKAILMSLYDAAKYVKTWTLPFVMIAVLAMIPLFWKIIKNTKFRFPMPFLVLFLSFGMYAAQFTPNEYALGFIGAYRVQNIYRFQMIYLLFGSEFYLLGWLHNKFPEINFTLFRKAVKGLQKIPALSVLYCLVMGSVVICAMYMNVGSAGASYSAFKSLRDGSAAIYYQEYQERMVLLEDESISDVVVKPFTCPPSALFFEDWKAENSWENEHAAQYYGKKSIIVESKTLNNSLK